MGSLDPVCSTEPNARTDDKRGLSRRVWRGVLQTGRTALDAMNQSRSTRETAILAAAVTAVPLLVAGGISVLPQLHGLWPTVIGIAVLAVIIGVVGVQIVRSARKLLIGQPADTEIVAYTDDRETGILLKGTIENVSLRVTTIHRIIDTLTSAIPAVSRQDALYQCGCEVGKTWVSDFRHELPRLEIARGDILRQLLKWSEYDATAGMGRLTVAVNPHTGEGVVTLANGFLSRTGSEFPLNWWFAGYLAGTLHELLGRKVTVDILDPTTDAASTALFRVTPVREVDHRSVARLTVWLQRARSRASDRRYRSTSSGSGARG
jgi:hypothetical protein